MMPMPPTSSEMEAIATITSSKIRCVRRCSASSSDGTTIVKSSAPWCVSPSSRRTTRDAGTVASAVGICR